MTMQQSSVPIPDLLQLVFWQTKIRYYIPLVVIFGYLRIAQH
jgi:hypothetical protein